MRILAILLICLVILSCSGFSSAEDIDENEILEMLEDIRIAFNLADVDQIMTHYHDDFFHNGDLFEDEVIRWESRLNNYVEIDILDIDIDLNDDFAVVYFELTFRTSESSESWSEPSDTNGDLSYLIFDLSRWQIYGNQLDPDYLP